MRTELSRDTRGAVLIMTIFVSLLLVGVLYYLTGIGEAIRHGDRLRDASDTGAYAAAVMHARGMNLLALLNIVKLATVALVASMAAVAWAAVETIDYINRKLAKVCGFNFICRIKRKLRRILWGPMRLPLAVIGIEAAVLANGSALTDTMEATDRAQSAIENQLGQLAEAQAAGLAAQRDGIEGGFLVPKGKTPTEDEPIEEFCARVEPDASLWGRISTRPILKKQAWETDTIPTVWHSPYLKVWTPIGIGPWPREKAWKVARERFWPACLAQVPGRRVTDPLGSEPYQLRFYAVGETIGDDLDRAVRLAAWGRNENGGRTAALRKILSRVGFAQAEYYFDGNAEQAQMLWQMQWRARFRRFRETTPDVMSRECANSGTGVSCADIRDAIERSEELIVH